MLLFHVEQQVKRISSVGPEAHSGAGCRQGSLLSLLHGRSLNAVAGENLVGEVTVGVGPTGTRIVKQNRLAVARSLGQPDIAWNDRLEQFVLEEFPQILGDLLRQVGTVVIHGQQNALDFERAVEGASDPLESLNQLADSLQSEILSLHRDEKTIRGDEGVQGEQIERRGTVEDDEIVEGAHFIQGFAEAESAPLHLNQLHIRPREVLMGGNDAQSLDFCGEGGFLDGGLTHEDLIGGAAGLLPADPIAARGVGLRVAVDQKDMEGTDVPLDAVDTIQYQPLNKGDNLVAEHEVHTIIARRHGFNPDAPDVFNEWNTIKSEEMVGKIFDAMDLFLGGVGLVTLGLGAVGIINIMLVSVTERTREIGLRKALGATKRSILFQFFLEGLTLTAFSGVIGIAGSAVFMWILQRAIGDGLQGFDPPRMAPWSAAVALIALSVCGIVAGLYPAAQAAALEPVEALRRE